MNTRIVSIPGAEQLASAPSQDDEDVRLSKYRLNKAYWDDRMGSERRQKENWQRLAFLLGAVLAVSMGGNIYLGGQAKTVPYVIEKDRLGQIAYLGPIKPAQHIDNDTWMGIKTNAVGSFIERWRTVTTDPTYSRKNWDEAFDWIGADSPAKTFLDRWYRLNNPDKRAQNASIAVTLRNTLPEGQSTLLAVWDETTTSLNGGASDIKTYRATFTYAVHVPKDPKIQQLNPFGVLITEIHEREEN